MKEKISNRQIMRLYVFDLMGIGTLLLPPYLTKLCGEGGIYAILLGTGVGILYLFYLGWIMHQMKGDCFSFLRKEIASWVRWSVLIVVMFHSIFTAGFCAYVFANLMQYSLVKETNYVLILFLIIVVAAYAVSGGIENRARVYEVLFWFILLPYIGMMLVSVRTFEWEYIAPILSFQGNNLWKGSYLVFLLLTPLFFSLFFVGEENRKQREKRIKSILTALLCSAGILLGSYVLLLGNFGANALASLRFPVVTLMSTIQFEGNFLKRMDALMLAVWFFTLYALLNFHLHYGVKMLSELGKKFDECRVWKVILPATAVFFIAYGMHRDDDWQRYFFAYYSYGAVPFMVIVPAILLLIRKGKIDDKSAANSMGDSTNVG